MPTSTAQLETHERLLDAAEKLFASRGFEAVSLRDITAAAEANVASVNYHFGGKENLITAVMARHANPVNEERRMRIQSLMERDQAPTVREVVEAFLMPLVERIQKHRTQKDLFAKFMGRMMGEDSQGIPAELLPSFLETLQLVVTALQMAEPRLTSEQAYLRLKFCFAVTADAMMQDPVFSQISENQSDHWNIETLYEEVLSFCEGGLRA